MKRFVMGFAETAFYFGLIAAVLFLSAHFALAQPNEIEPEGLIQLNLGQAKAFEFREPIGQIFFAPVDVVQSVPQTDRTFSISPITSGSTRMFVRDTSGKLVYNVDIIVSPEAGHLVKHYGSSKNEDLNAGYSAVYCTETGCERPDKDLPKPTAITVERATRFRESAIGTR